MGNIQRQQEQVMHSKLDLEKLYRFFGIRMANEGDGYDITELDEYGKPSNITTRRNEASNVSIATGPAAVSSNSNTNGSPTWPELDQHPGNPGTVAELHRRCHDMLPQTFDGFRLNVSRMLGNCVTIGHALQVRSEKQTTIGCQFNCSVQGERLHELSGERFPLLVGEIDARGNIAATWMQFMTPRCRCKLTATVLDSVVQTSRLLVDYFGEDYTCSCVVSNSDVGERMGVFVASYLQQVTPRLALGVDVIYQRENIVPGGQAAVVSAVGRYQQDTRQWSAMLSLHAVELCYSQLYGQNLGASVQLQANILKRQAISRLCYHCQIPQMGFSFRGGIDTRGVISALLEKRLQPLPILLQLSGKLNHLSSRFRLGLGLTLG